MTILWISAGILTVLSLLSLLAPMLKQSKAVVAPARGDFDLTVYKDQLVEIDKDLERGVLSADQATSARTEIERRMLAIATEADVVLKNTPLPKWMVMMIVVMIPAGAFAMYMSLGEPTIKDYPIATREQPKDGDVNTRIAQLQKMIDNIKTQIEEDPTNPNNWARLAQARQMIGNSQGSILAYKKLVSLTNRNPEALMALAEAMFVDADDVVTPAAAALFKEAKIAMPGNPMTYYYLAIERQVVGDDQGAMDEYAGLLSISPSNGEWVPNIQDRMKALAKKSGLSVPAVKMMAPMQAKLDVPASGPTQEQIQDAQSMSGTDQNAMIQSMVTRLADKLKDNPDDLEGWKRLANAYKVLGDKGKMADAMMQISRLQGTKSMGPATMTPSAPVASSVTSSTSATPGPTRQQIIDAQSMSSGDQKSMIANMVQRLADKQKADPDNLEGWKRLENAYRVLGDQAGMGEAATEIKRLQAR
ncbi:MAG: c-type cytochrome biogenesis protein CcmI [Rhodospirillaceae bacterium]|nr:MAG: c-type cytochrome biogenesis protein CcmI [Rhodospirillaceae bacterium]